VEEPLPPIASKNGFKYYVPGSHLVDQPTVWSGSVLAARLTDTWRKPPSPTGFASLELAINGALTWFVAPAGEPLECTVRVS
jgi:hypothetical protein